jgi:hypothetical protein
LCAPGRTGAVELILEGGDWRIDTLDPALHLTE